MAGIVLPQVDALVERLRVGRSLARAAGRRACGRDRIGDERLVVVELDVGEQAVDHDVPVAVERVDDRDIQHGANGTARHSGP